MKAIFRNFLLTGILLGTAFSTSLSAQKLKTITQNFADSSKNHKVEYKYTVIDKAPYDTRHGKYQWFFDNGHIKALTNYKNGNKNGRFATYNRWGSRRAEGNFQNNRLHGEFRNYRPGGGIDYIGSYVDGYRHGKWKYYYPGGGVKKVVEYNMGREVEPDTAKGG